MLVLSSLLARFDAVGSWHARWAALNVSKTGLRERERKNSHELSTTTEKGCLSSTFKCIKNIAQNNASRSTKVLSFSCLPSPCLRRAAELIRFGLILSSSTHLCSIVYMLESTFMQYYLNTRNKMKETVIFIFILNLCHASFYFYFYAEPLSLLLL